MLNQYYCHFLMLDIIIVPWLVIKTCYKTFIVLIGKQSRNHACDKYHMSWWFSPYPCNEKIKSEKGMSWVGKMHVCGFEEDAWPLSVLYSWFIPKLEEVSLHLFALVLLVLTWYQQASACTVLWFTKCGNSHSLESAENKEMETLSLPQL